MDDDLIGARVRLKVTEESGVIRCRVPGEFEQYQIRLDAWPGQRTIDSYSRDQFIVIEPAPSKPSDSERHGPPFLGSFVRAAAR